MRRCKLIYTSYLLNEEANNMTEKPVSFPFFLCFNLAQNLNEIQKKDLS